MSVLGPERVHAQEEREREREGDSEDVREASIRMICGTD